MHKESVRNGHIFGRKLYHSRIVPTTQECVKTPNGQTCFLCALDGVMFGIVASYFQHTEADEEMIANILDAWKYALLKSKEIKKRRTS